ncbi:MULTISPECIES: hypothetical protein [Pseudomonas]|uniref:Uncharacterized protein n=1 Tax=Pseudomonas folii TaxID=2762593 RepID=A0ABR7AWB6_9PSED|nr:MULTISPECIES: hypothetical protein [Pseudomonas]MBC3949217.1 hypothetical protein [Pseudomonas folii]
MNAPKIVNIFLVVITTWLLTANIMAVSKNLKENNNFIVTPLVTAIDNITEGALTQAYTATTGLSVAVIKKSLQMTNDGGALRLSGALTQAHGYIDSFSAQGSTTIVSGWGYVDEKSEQSQQYLLIVKSGEVISVTRIDGLRSDVKKILGLPRSERSGFSLILDNPDNLSKCDYKYYILSESMQIYPFEAACS